MDDQSHLDSKYFVSTDKYNCPFCNRRHVTYYNLGITDFDWSNQKKCSIWRIKCASCEKVSIHMTSRDIFDPVLAARSIRREFRKDVELDQAFFYSAPTSFFVMDRRIPTILRELVTEAEGCSKMNYLTGASACTRKAIYEFLRLQNATGQNYDEKIKDLKTRNSNIDSDLFDIIGHIKDMTSDHIHEQSWVAWDSGNLRVFLEALKAVLHEIYVVPKEKRGRADSVRALREQLSNAKSDTRNESNPNADGTEPD